MSKIQSISIPQPCSQSWQQMEIKGQGRHCVHCTKTVVDFSKMTNDEILAYLAGKENVCGRFGQMQFAGISYQVGLEGKVASKRWKKWLVAASLLGFCFSGRASAQSTPVKPATTQNPSGASNDETLLGKILISGVRINRTIVGEVIGADDKLPVFGALIKIKGMNTGVTSDKHGCFSLSVPAAGPVILIVSYIGYKTQEITVLAADSGKSITIAMQPAQFTMGEIVIPRSKSPSERVLMLNQYMPWPINRLFK